MIICRTPPEQLLRRDLPEIDIRNWVRTGDTPPDTPPAERGAHATPRPHTLVTTRSLSTCCLAPSPVGGAVDHTLGARRRDSCDRKRGAHLAFSLERLAALCGDRLLRIGLSATQNPIDAVADLLSGVKPDGTRSTEVAIIDTGHPASAVARGTLCGS